MGIIFEETNNLGADLKSISGLIFKPDKDNIPVIYFEAVENPNQILKLIQKAKHFSVSQ